MKTIEATLYIQVNVDCPYCDSYINLLDEDDTNGFDHNEDGQVLSQACTNGCWSEDHKKFEVDCVTCSSCGHDFNVKGLDW